MSSQELVTISGVLQGGASNRILTACSDSNGNLYTVESNHIMRGYQLETLVPLVSGNTSNLPTNSAGLCVLTDLGSALVGNTGTAAGALVELSSMYNTTFGSGATWTAVAAAIKPQQMAYNPVTQYAAGNSSVADGTWSLYNASTATPTKQTLSGHTSEQVLTVIARPGSSTFFLGTSAGNVLEVNTSGTIQKVIDTKTALSATGGSITTSIITSLFYFNDTLLVANQYGLLFNYKYSTSTLLETKQVAWQGNSITFGGACLSVVPGGASSQVVWGQYADTSTGSYEATQRVLPTSFTVANIPQVSGSKKLQVNKVFKTDHVANFIEIGLDYSVNKLYTVTYNNTANTNNARELSRVMIYDIKPPLDTTVPTRIQNPPGTDVTGRIIRIRDLGPGKSYVHSDQTVSAGQVSLNALQTGEYYEIALVGPASGYSWDWRKFNC